MAKLSNRLAELIERVTGTPGAISQTLSASEWHELQTELSDFACDIQAATSGTPRRRPGRVR